MNAFTNPQHIPWEVSSTVPTFHVPEDIQRNSQVVRFVHNCFLKNFIESASPENIQRAAMQLLNAEE